MKKKFLSVFFCLCVVFALTPVTVFAAENTVDTWDGSVDTSWYDANSTEFHITTAEQLAGISQLASEKNLNFEDVTLNLTTDVNLSGYSWTPIKKFSGIFNGGNHTVYNMYVEQTEGQSGFFEYLQGAHVMNLTFAQDQVVMPNTNRSFYHGILAGWTNSETIIRNCGVSGSIIADATSSDVPAVGGFIGSCKGNTSIFNCWSIADVTTTSPDMPAMVGGLVGQWENAADGAQIIDSYFGGTVSVAESTTSAAGILGAGLSFNGEVVLISGCVSYGQLKVPVGVEENAVHIAALDEDGQAENCMWPSDGKTGVVRLVVDWDTGTANADPNFDESVCGQAVADFSSPNVIQDLNANAQTEKLWILGINGYPVFSYQTDRIRADYSSVDTAKAKIPINLSLYTDESVRVLNVALDSVKENMCVDNQAEVDAMAKAINDAIAALEYKDADYSKVDEAIAKAEALHKDNYKDFSQVENAIQAVVRGKNITEQAEVDAMAKAINDAIAALEYKDADYSKVDEAIAKAEALHKDNYKDFSQVENAIQAVVRGKNITEQAEVDAMAKAIVDAIAALEYKDADYSKVDEAIVKAKALNPADYTDFSAVEDAMNKVVRGKNITEQDEVDAMSQAIETAIANLEKKPIGSSKPDGPTKPVQTPDFPTQITEGQTDSTTVIKTGDNSHVVLWGSLILISAGIALILVVHRKKRN